MVSVVVRLVYLLSAVSAAGDRLWTFSVGLLLMIVSDSASFQLTATHGLVTSLSLLVLAAPLGHWVDRSDRLKAAQTSLLVQNASVVVCGVFMLCLLQLPHMNTSFTSDHQRWLSPLLQTAVIVTADLASLASMTYKITIHKHWIVLICGSDHHQLAWMNSTLRSIDLTTLLLTPALAGQLLSLLSPSHMAAALCVWNLTSLGVELALLRFIFHRVTSLHHHICDVVVEDRRDDDAEVSVGCWQRVCSLAHRLANLQSGWSSFFSGSYCWAGLALALLYLTVLGFDNVTTGYGLLLGLPSWMVGVLTSCGAATGITGSLFFPALRSRLGLKWCGVLGFSLAAVCQLLSAASVFLPGSLFEPFSTTTVPATLTTNSSILSDDLDDLDEVTSRGGVSLSVVLFYTGIISARFGLWVSDLSVTQCLQQTVNVERRGAVAAVQHACNMMMEAVKFFMLMMFPLARQFGWLVLLSCSAWTVGLLLYLRYVFICDKPCDNGDAAATVALSQLAQVTYQDEPPLVEAKSPAANQV